MKWWSLATIPLRTLLANEVSAGSRSEQETCNKKIVRVVATFNTFKIVLLTRIIELKCAIVVEYWTPPKGLLSFRNRFQAPRLSTIPVGPDIWTVLVEQCYDDV